jgi:hypothetical protein
MPSYLWSTAPARIVKGGDLAGEGDGEGVGGLLAMKGGGCNLDVGTCNSMANQRKEFPTVDICKPPRRRPGRAGWAWCSGERCPRRSWRPPSRRQVWAERHIDSLCVRQVHGLGHVGLPPAPTLLLVDDDDGCNDHFNNPG